MQAAARSYRLNQTHDHCKTYYMFALNTMEHTAVQLMSRKQRAAKLLTGNIGLTGLDELTNGEGGFEAALLNAISQEEALDDPRDMFKIQSSELDTEDANYWQIETDDLDADDTLIETAIALGAVVRPVPEELVVVAPVGQTATDNKLAPVYMEGVLAGMGLESNESLSPINISARTDAEANAILATMGMSSKDREDFQSAKAEDEVEREVKVMPTFIVEETVEAKAMPTFVVEDPDEANHVTTKELVLASFGFGDTTYVLNSTPDPDETVPAVADPVADEAVAVVAKPVVNETIAIVAKPVATDPDPDEDVPAVTSKIIDFQAVSQQKVTTKPKRRRKVNLDAVPDDSSDIRQLAMF